MVSSTLPVIRDCILISLGTIGVEVTSEAVLINNQIDAPTNIKVNAGSVAYVLSDEAVTYDVSGGGAINPLASDRAAWDALAYPTRHANDVDDEAGIHHSFGIMDTRYTTILETQIFGG